MSEKLRLYAAFVNGIPIGIGTLANPKLKSKGGIHLVLLEEC
ncbi:hypothetical protein [Selenomonas montiformis]|nr:hypothetical protein [Selenomonas montiformis]